MVGRVSYVYIFIYILFNPVNPELGTITRKTIKIFKNRILNLDIPGKELNVNKIHRANKIFLKTTTTKNKKQKQNKTTKDKNGSH